MGASGTPDLRELAMMGFGRYDVTQSQAIGGGTPTLALTFSYPPDGSAGGRLFRLLGYMMIADIPPDLLNYSVEIGAGGATAKSIIAQDSREPLMYFVSPEQPVIQIYASVRSYLNSAYFTGTPFSFYVDHLTGSMEQLKRLLRYLAEKQAPTSLIEGAVDTIESLAGVATGDYY